ncbi:MAG TPA: DUF4340 domain-containing protein [Bryobacteraceae bacterium]|nr:DUF4340 domain-containing protein [Bryobacteraceae bacterium]
MRFRGLMLGTLVLVGLAAAVYFSNKQKSAEASKPPADAPPKIMALPDGDISKIAIRKHDADEVILDKNAAGKWEITFPKAYGADQDAANQLASAAGTITADKLIEEKASDLSGFGLKAPEAEIDITSKKSGLKKLRIGDDAPANGGTYVALAGDPRVFTVASYTKTSLEKSLNDLRDKRLLTFDQDKLSRVELIAKKQDIEFGRDKDQWQIVKPKPLRADGLQVEELIRKIKDAKMDLTVSEEDAKKAAASFGTGTPVGTVKMTDPSGTQQLEVRKVKDDYYAKSSVVDGVHKVAADLGTALDKSVDDFRNKKLFDFGFNDPSKIEMHSGGKTYAFQKTGEEWFANGKKMDSTSVQSFVDKLRDLAASKFIDSGTAGAPALDVSVTSNNGKRVEKVLISKQGNDYIAQRENEPALYGMDAKAVDDLTKAASDVKEAQPVKKK